MSGLVREGGSRPMSPSDFATALASAAVEWCDDDHELILGLNNEDAALTAPCFGMLLADDISPGMRSGVRDIAVEALAHVIENAMRREREAIVAHLREAVVRGERAFPNALATPFFSSAIRSAAIDIEIGAHAAHRSSK